MLVHRFSREAHKKSRERGRRPSPSLNLTQSRFVRHELVEGGAGVDRDLSLKRALKPPSLTHFPCSDLEVVEYFSLPTGSELTVSKPVESGLEQ